MHFTSYMFFQTLIMSKLIFTKQWNHLRWSGIIFIITMLYALSSYEDIILTIKKYATLLSVISEGIAAVSLFNFFFAILLFCPHFPKTIAIKFNVVILAVTIETFINIINGLDLYLHADEQLEMQFTHNQLHIHGTHPCFDNNKKIVRYNSMWYNIYQ